MASPVSPLRIVSVDKDHGIGAWGPMTIAVWRGIVTPLAVSRALESMRIVMRDHSGEAMAVHVVEDVAPVPDDVARTALLKLLKASGEGLCCATIVGEGDGFSNSVVRTIVAGLTLVIRPGAPMKVFGTAGEAAVWAITKRPPRCKSSLSATDFVTAIEATRQSLKS